jgi:Tfp pilus assembly protein PilV
VVDHRQPARDRGVSFVEVLVAIVLLGTVVVAVLAGVRATIIASTVDRDHTTATAWLQSASDVLYGVTRSECSSLPDVIDSYEAVVQATPNSESWDPSRIQITDVKFWDGNAFQTSCNAQTKTLQLISLRVVDLDGSVLESIDVIKGGEIGEVPSAP